MWEDDEGEYSGVGMELLGNAQDYTVTINRVFRDTPAEAAGIRKGDILVRVDDIEVDFYSMQNAVNVMRGSESDVGETVEIEVYRGEEFITFEVPRAIIHINRVEYTIRHRLRFSAGGGDRAGAGPGHRGFPGQPGRLPVPGGAQGCARHRGETV